MPAIPDWADLMRTVAAPQTFSVTFSVSYKTGSVSHSINYFSLTKKARMSLEEIIIYI